MRNVINALRTLIYLQEHKGQYVRAGQLAEELEIDERTIRRYMRYLSTDTFFPIQSRPGRNGGYIYDLKKSDVAFFPLSSSREDTGRFYLSLLGLATENNANHESSLLSAYIPLFKNKINLTDQELATINTLLRSAIDKTPLNLQIDNRPTEVIPTYFYEKDQQIYFHFKRNGGSENYDLILADISI